MSRHSPAPWRVGPVNDTTVRDANGIYIADVVGDYCDPTVWPVMEANARLIASAPDLLEALKWASERLIYHRRLKGQNEEFCDAVDRMNAAIAKATGAA